jgi:hypothetical protein
MDFMNRPQQPRAGVPSGNHAAAPATATTSKKKDDDRQPKWFRVTSVSLLLSVAILVAAVSAYIGFFRGSDQESKFVNTSAYQAVFVNVNGTSGGQVYFGHVTDLTDQFLRLTNVFYIQNQSSSNSSSNNAYTLVKLGCELHGPQDEMIINKSQVYFWENLKSNGQVAQKIADYYKQNPNGQNCSQSSSSSSTTQSNTNTQSSSSAGTSTGNTSSTSSKKP